jgi:hypothetical protein
LGRKLSNVGNALETIFGRHSRFFLNFAFASRGDPNISVHRATSQSTPRVLLEKVHLRSGSRDDALSLKWISGNEDWKMKLMEMIDLPLIPSSVPKGWGYEFVDGLLWYEEKNMEGE